MYSSVPRCGIQRHAMSAKHPNVIESAISQFRSVLVTEGNICRSHWCVRESVKLSLRRARFDSSAVYKADGVKTAKVASLLSLMTPNAGALGPMIPAMEHRDFSVLTIAVVAGVALLVVLYGLSAVLMLIAGYLPD